MNEEQTQSTTTEQYSEEKRNMLEMMCTNLNGDYHKLLAERLMLESCATDPMISGLYRKHVCAHNERIADLQIMFKTFIVTSSETPQGHLPFPESINIKQTLQRYGRGC